MELDSKGRDASIRWTSSEGEYDFPSEEDSDCDQRMLNYEREMRAGMKLARQEWKKEMREKAEKEKEEEEQIEIYEREKGERNQDLADMLSGHNSERNSPERQRRRKIVFVSRQRRLSEMKQKEEQHKDSQKCNNVQKEAHKKKETIKVPNPYVKETVSNKVQNPYLKRKR